MTRLHKRTHETWLADKKDTEQLFGKEENTTH